MVRNGENTIEKTIKSIANQTFREFEHILIDGKSTDKTIEKINKYKKIISKIVSEKTEVYMMRLTKA